MSAHLSNSLVLDGYRLIRFLGRGGFGEVWLCRSESMGDYRALKYIPTSQADRLEKEYEALLHFRKAAARLRTPHLVSIEHVGHNDAGLYYVMPLADGSGAADPSDPAWVPVSLTTMIHERSEMPTWFSSQEIIALIPPVLEALQTLSIRQTRCSRMPARTLPTIARRVTRTMAVVTRSSGETCIPKRRICGWRRLSP